MRRYSETNAKEGLGEGKQTIPFILIDTFASPGARGTMACSKLSQFELVREKTDSVFVLPRKLSSVWAPQGLGFQDMHLGGPQPK